ncbi:aminotransferase class IV [Proteinivorax tanatarense]|uniref:Aminotransferase class IV n=1 Tax=Proteinivorax tanatarense TaxID=1260629 RepID=A0AAU7VK26_9FIRM
MYILVNGKAVKKNHAKVTIDSKGFQYGHSVFETIKVDAGKIFFLEDHIERLQQSCKKVGIETQVSYGELYDQCNTLLNINRVTKGVLKILCAKGDYVDNLIISSRENTYNKEEYDKGFKLGFADEKRNPYSSLTYIKSGNYLENWLAKEKGMKAGFKEVIFLNIHNKIAEGAISNIFFVKNNIIYTPDITCGILPGIMREKVIHLARNSKLQTKVGCYNKNELLSADEVFITNSLLEIMPVSQIEMQKYNTENNIVTTKLRKAFKVTYLEQKEG